MASNTSFPLTQRVQVPNNWVLEFWVIGIVVQALGKYMIIRYLDPQGNRNEPWTTGTSLIKFRTPHQLGLMAPTLD